MPPAESQGAWKGRSMATVFDYLLWRGDLSFSDARFGEVDGVIFSMLSYIDFEKLCAGEEKSLTEAAEGYCSDKKYGSVNLGLLVPSKSINRLFCEASETKRFGPLKVSDYLARTDDSDGYQFCAVSFHLPGKAVAVVYRGTDDSIAGWHENCRLSFCDSVPAQIMAVEYLEMIAEKYPDSRIYLCGHSKGGNLALYAATGCKGEVQSRIRRVFCNDGPGLAESLITSAGFAAIQKKLTVLIPQSSYIGIMFERGEKYTVIKSTGKVLLQHDPFTWVLEGPQFLELSSLSKRGKKNELQFRTGMGNMTQAEKEEFVETLFSVIESTGAKTLTDFTEKSVAKLLTFIKSYSGLDKEKKAMMVSIFLKLLDLKKEKGSKK